MKQILLKRIFPALVCVALLIVMALPVSAAANDDGIISLAEPSRIFNDDGTVTVTYDLPLAPYSKIYGQPVGSADFVLIGDTTNIYFTQDKDESITVFTTLSSGSVSSTTSGSSGNGRVWTSASMEPQYFDVAFVTYLVVNGVFYPVEFVSDENCFAWYDTDPSAGSNYEGRYILYSPRATTGVYSWSFMSKERLDADLMVGYYEDVMISQHEYDALYPVLSPFGVTEDGNSNLIDISDIRSAVLSGSL